MNRRRSFLVWTCWSLVFCVASVFYLKSFTPRFENKTVSDWLDEFARRGEVDTKVAQGFGIRAVPTLSRILRNSSVHYYLPSVISLDRLDQNTRRIYFADKWLDWLRAEGYAVPAEPRVLPARLEYRPIEGNH